MVYKLKEEHAKEEDQNRKKKKEKHRQRKRAKREKKELYRLPKKNDCCANLRLSIYVRVNLFIIQKLTLFFTPTLYKSYCLSLFKYEPNMVTGRYKSRPYNYYLKSFPYLGPSFFGFKNAPTPLCLSRDKTKKQSGKNTTLTPTKILPKK